MVCSEMARDVCPSPKPAQGVPRTWPYTCSSSSSGHFGARIRISVMMSTCIDYLIELPCSNLNWPVRSGADRFDGNHQGAAILLRHSGCAGRKTYHYKDWAIEFPTTLHVASNETLDRRGVFSKNATWQKTTRVHRSPCNVRRRPTTAPGIYLSRVGSERES